MPSRSCSSGTSPRGSIPSASRPTPRDRRRGAVARSLERRRAPMTPPAPTSTENGAPMPDTPHHVYVVHGLAERDYADCQAALTRVAARLTSLPFIGDEETLIERTRDADGLVVVASPITRRVMTALDRLQVVVRTGVGFDVIDVPAATDLGVVVVNIPDLWIREVANHALTLLLAWNRKLIALNNEVKSGIWQARVPGPVTGSLHGETVGIVGLGNIGSAFARRVAALETTLSPAIPTSMTPALR